MKKRYWTLMAFVALSVCSAADSLFPDLAIPPECETAFAAVDLEKEPNIILVTETSRLLETAYKGGDIAKDVSALWQRHQKDVETLVAAFQKSPDVASPNRQKLTYDTQGGYLPNWRTSANLLLLQAIINPHTAQKRISEAVAIGRKSLRYPVSVVAYFASIRILADSARTLVLLKRRGDLVPKAYQTLMAEFPPREAYATGFAFALDGDYRMLVNMLEDSEFDKQVEHWSNHRVSDTEKLDRALVRRIIANRYQDLRRDFALGLPVQNMTVPTDLGKTDREFLAFAMVPADIYNRVLRIVCGIDLLLQGKIGINFR